MRKQKLLCAALSAVLVMVSGVAAAVAASVPAEDARVVAVTLYADRAEVVRQARVSLPAGASAVEFTDVPLAVDGDSFRASARGVPSVLGAVEIKPRAAEPEESRELIAAREEVRRLEGELALLAERAKVASELRAYLTSIRAASATEAGERLAEGQVDPSSIQAVFGLLRTNLDVLAREEIERQQARQRLERELQLARAKLETARPAGGIRSHTVAVQVEARQAGALTLELAYVVHGAAWRPTYRASLDPATGDVALAAEAAVRQSTGEDWKDVTLKLSTAAPARGVEPPVLISWMLRPAPLVLGRSSGDEMVADLPVPGRLYQNVLTPAPGVQDAAAPPAMPAEIAEAAIVRSAYNVSFEVPGKSDVPADGTEYRVVLRQETLPGKVLYRTVPALNPAAYLTATTKAPAGYPLLGGPVRVFAQGAFLGMFQLPETGPASELKLPFGVDNRVKVERVPLPQERSREGLTGKTKQIAYAFRTTLENLREEPIELWLEDRVPVAEDDRIEVEIEKGTTPGYTKDEDRPGVLLWTLELKPREKREITLAYTVRHPRDLFVPGLE